MQTEPDCTTSKLFPTIVETTQLSAKEQFLYFALAAAAIQVRTEEDFKDWIRTEVRAFFPHGIMQAAAGTMQRGSTTSDCVISVGFRTDYLAEITTPAGNVESPILNRWLKEHKPQLFDPSGKGASPSQPWLQNFERFDLRNIAAHGLADSEGKKVSYFTFARIQERLGRRHGYLLELMVPHLHRALMQVAVRPPMTTPSSQSNPGNLTSRETQVLWWMTTGKTNPEIGWVLGRSEKTISNHAHSIFKKLGVSNRTQAVTRAASLHLVPSLA